MDNELYEAIDDAITPMMIVARIDDVLYPIVMAVRNEKSLPQVLSILTEQRKIFQDMSDKLGRLAVAIQVGTQAVVDFRRSLEDEQP